MKNTHPILAPLASLGLLIFAAGCGNSAQKQAYDNAAAHEQTFTIETAPAIIAEYRQVIAMEPGSSWAKKAETRIAAIEAREKAEEAHKEVFQEHGID